MEPASAVKLSADYCDKFVQVFGEPHRQTGKVGTVTRDLGEWADVLWQDAILPSQYHKSNLQLA